MAGFTYKSYSFVDKDPMIDQLRTVVKEAGVTYKTLSESSGVSTTTLTKWFGGETKKPQAATFNAVLRALGYKLSIRPIDQPEIILFTPEPPKTSVRHVVNMAKYRKGAGARR